MSSITTELFVILLLLVLNGVFAMSEMAVVAARKTRLEQRAEDGDAGARAALDLAAHPTNFLSTVQVGITLVGVLAGAFGGARIAEALAARFATVPWLAPYAHPVAFGVVVAAITYLSLILGELVPKRVALGNPERVAALVARPMRLVSRVGAPLVALLTGSTNLVFRMLGMRVTVDPAVTEQDIRAMVEQGAEAGVILTAEHAIVENTFRLGDRQVGSIMTPRPDVRWLDVERPLDEFREELASVGEPRFLVCEGDLDNVLGIVYVEDLLARCLTGQAPDLRSALHQPLFVPDTMPALRLVEEFRRERQQVAVVLDEFGGVQGVATVDDILEALVGDLPEPGDTDRPEVERQPDGSWLVDGAVALEDFEAALHIDPLPEEDRRGVRTVAGLIMAHLGRIPRPGEAVEVGETRLTVERMDGRRVDRVRVGLVHRGADVAG
jgi:putative hemolysin